MKLFSKVIALFAMISTATALHAETQLYVSPSGNDANAGTFSEPFKTMHKAKQKVRELLPSAAGPVNIYLRKGTYYLDSTLVFTNLDGGSASTPVTYAAFRGEKVVVSGAKKITPAWSTHKGSIQVAAVGKNLKFDQLFLGGVLQIMARYPNYDSAAVLNGSDGKCLNRLGRWNNVAEGPGYFRCLHDGRWGGNSFIMTGKSGGSVTLQWVGDNNRGNGTHRSFRMVENLFEELDAPGEWFYSKTEGKLYFYPPAGANLASDLIEIASLDELVMIEGTSVAKPVRHLTFKNLVFMHTHRTMFNLDKPYEKLLLGDWCVVRSGAILMKNAENVTVKGCLFDRIGGNGIFMSGYNRDHHVYNNRFVDNGATCVMTVGDTAAVRTPTFWTSKSEWTICDLSDTKAGPKSEDYPRDILIENNYMYNMGRFEKQVAGVNVSMSARVTIRHNTITRSPRSGININDGTWGGHVVEYNDVSDCVREGADHGLFNSWGRDRFWSSSGTTKGNAVGTAIKPYALLDVIETIIIRNNRWEQPTISSFGIDLDDGSTNYRIYNNLLIKCSIKCREGFFRKVYNNIQIKDNIQANMWYYGSCDTMRHNIIVNPSGQMYNNTLTENLPKTQAGFDYNLYWTGSVATKSRIMNVSSGVKRIRAMGEDVHSILGDKDPQFVNESAGDYRLKPTSPAITELGFVPFSLDSFGRMAVAPDTLEPRTTTVKTEKTLAGPVPHLGWSAGRMTVTYSLDRATSLSIALFSVNGRKAADLFRGNSAAGLHEKRWDVDGSALRSLAAGTYLLVVSGEEFRAVRPIVVAR